LELLLLVLEHLVVLASLRRQALELLLLVLEQRLALSANQYDNRFTVLMMMRPV
jgi:hypothetical protein